MTFLKKPDFLKTVLPISDEVNDILLGIFKLDPSHRLTIRDLRSKIIECKQFKRKHTSVSKKTLSPTGPANIQQSLSATCCPSNTSWSSCYSNLIPESSRNSLEEPNVIFSNTQKPCLVQSHGKDSCGPSLNTTYSAASSASEGSECCTPETQIKDILWNQTSIQKCVQAVADDEHLKDIYTDTRGTYIALDTLTSLCQSSI